MKKLLAILLSAFLLMTVSACGSSDSAEETNAKSVLNSVKAECSSSDEPVDVTIEAIDLLETQQVHNNEYHYYLVQTDSYEWGYAEFRSGEVNTFRVGYSKSEAKTRCKDLAEYRASRLGGIGQ